MKIKVVITFIVLGLSLPLYYRDDPVVTIVSSLLIFTGLAILWDKDEQ